MSRSQLRSIEIVCLTIILGTMTMLGVCWGPPGPPSTPVGNAGMFALTIAGMSAYGFWKMRR